MDPKISDTEAAYLAIPFTVYEEFSAYQSV